MARRRTRVSSFKSGRRLGSKACPLCGDVPWYFSCDKCGGWRFVSVVLSRREHHKRLVMRSEADKQLRKETQHPDYMPF